MKLEGIGGDRWALLDLTRWPPEGRWHEQERRGWGPAHYVHGRTPTRLLLEDPPRNAEVGRVWGDNKFGRCGWPVLAGKVFVDSWRAIIGEEPPYTDVRLSERSAGRCDPVPLGAQFAYEPREAPQTPSRFSQETNAMLSIYGIQPLNDVIVPGLTVPSGSIASQRSQIVVAPMSTW